MNAPLQDNLIDTRRKVAHRDTAKVATETGACLPCVLFLEASKTLWYNSPSNTSRQLLCDPLPLGGRGMRLLITNRRQKTEEARVNRSCDMIVCIVTSPYQAREILAGLRK